ncbi:ATP-binding protein [Sphingomonas sp. RS6]
MNRQTGDASLESTARAPGERRYLTILFADLSGSTAIANQLEAEEYDEILALLRRAYETVVAAHGGAVAQISGDGMVAIFGHELASEDDAVHAVDAAIELHDRIRTHSAEWERRGVELRLHSGIHSGLVLLRSGDALGGRYELPGSATNLAARLCDAAEADQILVSDATLGPERHRFEFSRRPITIKGRKLPVPALLVTARATEVRGRYGASVRKGLTPFVGRGPQRTRIGRALARAMIGGVEVVALSGPPGVGKTRLADECLRAAAAQGYEVLRGECERGGAPLLPFVQIAKGAADLLSTPVDGLESAIVSAAQHARLILFIDDWHLADDASRELLARLRTRDDIALLILLTVRTPAAPVAADVIELTPLDGAHADRIVQALVPAADPILARDVRAASGGNPLYIEEICHSIEGGRHAAQPLPASAWIDALVQSRLQQLAADDAELLRVASVIGAVVDRSLLTAIDPAAADEARLARLADGDFLFPGERPGTLRFKHGITRDAIYQAIGLRDRQRLHMRIAEALTRSYADDPAALPVEVLARHYARAGDDAMTADYAERAGDRALSLSALDRAQSHYRSALAALDRLPPSAENAIRWSRIAQRYGRAGVFDPNHDQLAIFRRAVERADELGDSAARAWAYYWLGFIHYGLGEPMAAIAHEEQALLAAVATQDRAFVGQIRAVLGQARAAAGDYAAGLQLLDESIAERRASGLNRPSSSLAYSLSCKALALGDLGRFDEAEGHFDEAMAAAAGAPREIQLSVRTQRAAVCLWQYRFEDALALAEQSAELSQLVGSRYSLAMSRAMTAYAQWAVDPAFDPAPVLNDTLNWLAQNGRHQFISLAYGWLADVSAAAGRIAETRHAAAGALRRGYRRDRLGEAMALRALARIAPIGGTRRPAGHWLDRADRAAQERGAVHDLAVNGWFRAALTPTPPPDAQGSPCQGSQAMLALSMRPAASVRLPPLPVPADSA